MGADEPSVFRRALAAAPSDHPAVEIRPSETQEICSCEEGDERPRPLCGEAAAPRI